MITHNKRQKESREKFLWGLLLEKSQQAFKDNAHIDSDTAYDYLTRIAQALETQPGWEHICHQHGKAQWFLMNDGKKPSSLPAEITPKQRYHHLVRLGGDMVRAGLTAYSKTTVLGALLYQRNSI